MQIPECTPYGIPVVGQDAWLAGGHDNHLCDRKDGQAIVQSLPGAEGAFWRPKPIGGHGWLQC